jgi:hypothetical protein
VGEQGAKYKVHKILLCEASDFFASALKEEWKEGQKHRVPLLDDDASVVDLYVQWLYTRRIVIRKRSVEEGKEEKEEQEVKGEKEEQEVKEEEDRREVKEERKQGRGGEGEERGQAECKNGHEFKVLIGAFVFGEKVQDGDFKDAVIDALIHTVATPDEEGAFWYPTKQLVDRAYTGTPEGSPIRRLLVDMHAFHGKRCWLDGQRNVDFLADLAGYLLRDRSEHSQALDSTTPDMSGCQYHHHRGEKSVCYSAKISNHIS